MMLDNSSKLLVTANPRLGYGESDLTSLKTLLMPGATLTLQSSSSEASSFIPRQYYAPLRVAISNSDDDNSHSAKRLLSVYLRESLGQSSFSGGELPLILPAAV